MENGNVLASAQGNVNAFVDLIALFRLASGSGGVTPPPPSSTAKSTTGPTTLSTKTTTASSPTQTGWNFLGCYADNVNGRTLVNQVQVAGGASAMSVEACETACKAAGYTIAGVEYSGECCKYLTKKAYWIQLTVSRVRQQIRKWRRPRL